MAGWFRSSSQPEVLQVALPAAPRWILRMPVARLLVVLQGRAKGHFGFLYVMPVKSITAYPVCFPLLSRMETAQPQSIAALTVVLERPSLAMKAHCLIALKSL